jgi:hypothetical protein
MLLESFGRPFLTVIILIYGLCCIISILFAFFFERYEQIEEKLNLNLFIAPVVTTLDIHINSIDSWAKQHNRVVGVTLGVFSIFIVASLTSVLIS